MDCGLKLKYVNKYIMFSDKSKVLSVAENALIFIYLQLFWTFYLENNLLALINCIINGEIRT